MTDTTLLLVEADILVRSPLAAFLRECGYRVLEADGGVEARTFLTQLPGIAIVLASIELEDETGFQLAGWIRDRHPDTEIILAGSTRAESEKAGDLCAREAPIGKPYDHQRVLERIKRSLASRSQGRS